MCGVWLPLYVVSTRFSFKGVATGRGGGGEYAMSLLCDQPSFVVGSSQFRA